MKKELTQRTTITIVTILISFLLCLLMIPMVSFAADSQQQDNITTTTTGKSFSDDTIVTSNNIIDVLDWLGVEHGSLEAESFDETHNQNYTVGDLKAALQTITTGQNSACYCYSDNDNEEVINNKANLTESNILPQPALASSTTKAKKLSITTHHDGYNLIHIANVKYKGKHFVSVSSSDINIDSDLLPLVYKISKERNISASCTSSKVTQHFDIDISCYVGVKYGIVKITTSRHRGNTYFYAKDFL